MTDPVPPARPSVWDLLRWLLVLPAAIMTYILVTAVLVQGASALHLPLSGGPVYVLVFSLGALAGMSTGVWTAPGYHFRAACGLTVLLALVLAYVVIGVALRGPLDSSMLRVALGELTAALIVTYLFWMAKRRATENFQQAGD